MSSAIDKVDTLVTKCNSSLVQLKEEAVYSVQLIDSKLDQSENERVILNKFGEISKQVQEEAIKSGQDEILIKNQWKIVGELANSQEIQTELNEQLQRCSSIMKLKDDVISMLSIEIRNKNRECKDVIRTNTMNIDSIAQAIENQGENCYKKYEKESKEVQSSLLDLRESLTSKYSADFSATLDQKRNLEMQHLVDSKNYEAKHSSESDMATLKDANNAFQLKIELESESQQLLRDLESLKDSLSFDSTKLTYDHRVLRQQDDEKAVDAEKSKRRITKLKGSLNSLVAAYQSVDKQHNKHCKELTEDYRTLTQKYKSLQLKFKHFEVADTNTYRQVWNMHKEECIELLDQLIQIDKIVTESLLGSDWCAPDRKFLRSQSDELQSRSLSTTHVGPDQITTISDENNNRKSKVQLASDLNTYWQAIENIIDDEKTQLWSQLLQDYSYYKVILEQNKSDLADIEDMKTRNALLKIQLQNKLKNSAQNDAFQISPVLALKMPRQAITTGSNSVSTYSTTLSNALSSLNDRREMKTKLSHSRTR